MTDEEYFDDEEFKEMLADYERTVESGQLAFLDADDLADIADYYQLHDRHDDAQQAMNRAVELQPDSIVALNYQVHEALNCHDYVAAEDYLAQMGDEKAAEYIFCRAEIWLAQGQGERADQYLRHCLNDISEDEYQDFVLDVVNLYTEYGDSEKGMEWMMRAYPEETDDFKELMGRTYFGIGAYDDSERIFNELIDRNPFQKRYWHELANIQYMKEDYGASVASSEYAIAIDPSDPEGLMSKANALFRLDNYEEALKYYERYSAKEPDDEFALLHQGSCLVNLRRYEEAVVRLKKAEEVAPVDSSYLADIYQELGFAYSEMNMPETALYYIDKTDDLDCDHNDMQVIRGHILLASGRVEEAESTYKKAIRESGNSPLIMMRVTVSLYDNQYVEAAYKMFLHFFKYVDKDWNQGYSYMALCCHDLLRFDEYLYYLKEACRRNPEEAKIALGFLFPVGMKPQDYYEFAKKKLKK